MDGAPCTRRVVDAVNAAGGLRDRPAGIDQGVDDFAGDDALVHDPHRAELHHVVACRVEAGGFGVEHHIGQIPDRAVAHLGDRGAVDQVEVEDERPFQRLQPRGLEAQHEARIGAERPDRRLVDQVALGVGDAKDVAVARRQLQRGARLGELALVQPFPDRTVERDGVEAAQKFGRVAVVEHDPHVGAQKQDADRDLLEDLLQADLFPLDPGGLLGDGPGGRAARLAQRVTQRRGRRRQIAEPPGRAEVYLAGAGMGPRAQRRGEALRGTREAFVHQEPDQSRHRQDAEPGHGGGGHEPRHRVRRERVPISERRADQDEGYSRGGQPGEEQEQPQAKGLTGPHHTSAQAARMSGSSGSS